MTRQYHIKKVVNPDSVLENCTVSVSDGVIADVRPESSGGAEGTWHYAVPGFIDIHTHGGGGHELMDGTPSTFDALARYYIGCGTTSFLSSTVTAPLDRTQEVLWIASSAILENERLAREGRQARCLGLHLEGPWLSAKNLGAQNPACCIAPGAESMAMIEKYSPVISMATFSYHTPESKVFLDKLSALGIIPACGHDEAVDYEIEEAFRRGVKVITHIYCVTSGFGRRDGRKHLGTIEMALMTPGIAVEVIADGHHITKYIWDFIRHNKTMDDIIVVTDSMRCAGLATEPGKAYDLGGVRVFVEDGVAWTEDRSAYAGSVATMHSCFRRLVTEWGVSLPDAVKATSSNQARLLGLDTLGAIRPGMTADIVLMDSDFNLVKVIKSGVGSMPKI